MIKRNWNIISQLGIKSDMEMEQQKKIMLSNQISIFLFIIIFLLNTAVHFFYVKQSIFAHLSSFTILFMPILNKYGYNKLSSFLICFLTPSLTLLFTTIGKLDFKENASILGYIFPRALLISYIALPFILIGKKDKSFMVVMVVINVFFAFIFDYFHNLFDVDFFEVQLNYQSYYANNYFLIFPAALIILSFLFLTNINLKYENKVLQLVKELEQQKQIIEIKNKSITDSIKYAKKIQTAFLPKQEIIETVLPNSFILYLPRDIVSGDFYWIRQIDDLRIIIAADCTGHGVPGAFLSILGTTLLNDIIVSKNILKPNKILDELRIAVVNSLNQFGTSNENKDGMDISVCVYNPENNILEYSGANNSLYIVRESNLIEYKSDRQPVGVFAKEKPFTLHEINMKPNDSFYIFSDGYSSQFGGQKNDKLKTSRFKEYLLAVSKLDISNQKVELDNMLKTWQGNYEQIDDILVIGVKIT